MPRKSAEDRAGAYWRAGGRPPAPPDILSASAKALWRKIVGSKPYDYFEPAAQELLAQYCELCITQRLNFEQLRREPLNPDWQTMSARMQAPINSLAVKLRLSPSAILSKKHGILDEKEVDTMTPDSNVLLFGGGGPPRF
jgi:phage terminase small subunit